MKLSIIIPVWIISPDILNLTENALDSIKATAPEHELIIIDNASPLAGGYLRDKADIYIRNKVNLGYAKAMNQGFKLAKRDFIAVTQNDTRLSPGWAEASEDIFKEKVGSVHFRMIKYGQPMELGDKTYVTGRERWCTVAFCLLRKEVVGDGYDEGYGLGGFEDWDFMQKLWSRGWKTAYTTKACYQHLDSFTQLKLDQNERRTKDLDRREHFKERWGDYPEEALAKRFPDQVNQPYYEEFLKL